MVNELSMGLSVVKHEQEYMEVRERIHRMSEFTLLVTHCLLYIEASKFVYTYIYNIII